jgi:AMP phosphorylase
MLETREALRVLQQKNNRPADLEIRSINLASNLLELCLLDSPKELQKNIWEKYGNCYGWATKLLQDGSAFEKLKEIIKAQGGNPNIDSEDLKPGKYSHEVKSSNKGEIKKIEAKNLTLLAKMLGAPKQKGSGIFLNKKIGEKVEKGETIYTLFSESMYNLEETKGDLENFPIFTVG